MVDSINSNNNVNNLIELQNAQLSQLGAAATSTDAASTTQAEQSGNQKWIQDSADISDKAQGMLDKIRNAAVYSRKASQMPESFDSEKVSQFKTMLDSGRINDYLSSLNYNDLASNILNSPTGAAFASA